MRTLLLLALVACASGGCDVCGATDEAGLLCVTMRCAWPLNTTCVDALAAVLAPSTMSVWGGWTTAEDDDFIILCAAADNATTACAAPLCVNATFSSGTKMAACPGMEVSAAYPKTESVARLHARDRRP
jgi:hypothetical protein